MSDRAIELLNKFLKILNTTVGEYLTLVGDTTRSDLVPVGDEVKINDINTGAISNPLEHARRLKSMLIDQLDLRKAKSMYLDYIGELYYNIIRFPGEDDANYISRIINTIFTAKFSPLLIRDALLPYADDVEIIEGIDDGAFSEISFTNSYNNFNIIGQYIVKGAYATNGATSAYFFRVIMTNADPAYYYYISQIVQNFKVAGVGYDIIIN